MRPIGGELEAKLDNVKSYFTDSGRSSLRLFLKSEDNRKKRYLLPDFFCELIEEIFIEEKVSYSFYKINNDLSLNEKEILENKFDVLYIINYFGIQIKLNSLVLKDKIIIEDNVFFYNFENFNNYKYWFAFNSFRKISVLSSGSMIKTNLNLNLDLIKNNEAPFIKLKNNAKDMKYEFIKNNLFSEEEYIKKFNEAENRLDKQKEIFRIDNNSVSQFISYNFKNEQNIRKKRYDILYKIFNKNCINKKSQYYSYFVILINNRDEFRKKLMEKNIYLPIHWPKSTQENSLYNSIISIPLFEVYTDIEFEYLRNNL